jgi:hypothetical protein
MFRRFLSTAALAAALVATWGGTAGAAVTTGAPAIHIDQANPHLGDTVTFTVSVPKQIKNPRIQVSCFKGTTMGWSTAGSVTESFKLGGDSSLWKTLGGDASCEAILYYWINKPNQPQTFVSLATTTFAAAG